jgi:hypothetical protein
MTPTLTDTGKRLTAEQTKRIEDARKGPTISIDLKKGQTIVDSTPPHHWVRQAAIDHGLPENRKYGADTATGQIFYVDYEKGDAQ